MNNFDYKNMTPFKWFVLENFPFIENDFDAINDYHLFSKVVEYLNKTIDNMNLTGEQMENVTNAMTELQNYVNNYFDNLDVQDEINNKLDEMATDGTLENIINQEIFGELNTKVDNIKDDLIEEKEKIVKLQNKLNLHSIKDNLKNFPLLVIKKFIEGTTGYEMAAQGMTAKYKDDGTLDYIYLFGTYSTFGRLYIVKCGSMKTGLGWEYTFTDNVPNVHGSCLSYKDGYIYIGDNPNTANGVFTKYDIENDNYELIDISNVVPYLITGIVWDNETRTFLVNANNNNNLYILDENYNLISQYTHQYDGHVNYVMQGYDYKYGYEFRTVSSQSNSSLIFIFDCSNGKLLKTIEVGDVNGEIEDISINNGFALLYYNNFCNNYNEINMHAVTMCYIGGSEENTIYSKIQSFKYNNYINSMCTKQLQNINAFYYQNNHNNNELVRYCGTGTSSNPFSSGLALSYFLCSLSHIASQFSTTINVLSSSNTDDNAFHILGKHNIDRLIIIGNNNSLTNLHLENIDVNLSNINAIQGNSRRDTGIFTFFRCKDIEVHGSNNCLKMDIQNCSLILTDNGLNATSETLTSLVRRNIFVCYPGLLTAQNITRHSNLGDTT